MPNIDQLKSTLTAESGLARSNLYSVVLPFINNVDIRSDSLSVLAKNVTLPGRQISTSERQTGAKFEKMAYNHLVDDVGMTFYVTNTFNPKKYFEAWQNLIFNQESFELNFKKPGYLTGADGYGKIIEIRQLSKSSPNLPPTTGPFDLIQSYNIDESKDIIYTVFLEEAFPTSVNAIELGNELDGLIELNVQFSYTNWRSK